MSDAQAESFHPAGFEQQVRPRVEWIDEWLLRLMPETHPLLEEFGEACRYALSGGGKRLRPLLVLCTCEAAGGELETALPLACAWEYIHTYSLVHDDLPAMDDDELRRGRPTVHVAYDEPTAILVGDALLTRAFGILAEYAPSAELARDLTLRLAEAAGARGMVGGQAADLKYAGKSVNAEVLEFIHHHKTGALLHSAVRGGARIAGASGEVYAALDKYGYHLGLAFQVIDDILDVTASTSDLGKSAGKDLDQGKMTYPIVHGLDGSRDIAKRLVTTAIDALAPLKQGETLTALAHYVQHRLR